MVLFKTVLKNDCNILESKDLLIFKLIYCLIPNLTKKELNAIKISHIARRLNKVNQKKNK